MAPAYSPNVPAAAGLPEASSPQLKTQGRYNGGFSTSDAPRLPADMRTVQASFNESAQPVAVPHARPGPEPRFEQIQQRLRALGATYCRLESFGTSRQLYRFHCIMPLGVASTLDGAVAGGTVASRPATGQLATGQRATQHFEDTSENPLRSMENVLAQVESWLRAR